MKYQKVLYENCLTGALVIFRRICQNLESEAWSQIAATSNPGFLSAGFIPHCCHLLIITNSHTAFVWNSYEIAKITNGQYRLYLILFFLPSNLNGKKDFFVLQNLPKSWPSLHGLYLRPCQRAGWPDIPDNRAGWPDIPNNRAGWPDIPDNRARWPDIANSRAGWPAGHRNLWGGLGTQFSDQVRPRKYA